MRTLTSSAHLPVSTWPRIGTGAAGQRRLGIEITYLPHMIVYHPARTTFAELYEKWDRHIDHDAADYERVRFGRLRWVAYAIAVALSPALELPRILGSKRVSTMRDRWMAATAP